MIECGVCGRELDERRRCTSCGLTMIRNNLAAAVIAIEHADILAGEYLYRADSDRVAVRKERDRCKRLLEVIKQRLHELSVSSEG